MMKTHPIEALGRGDFRLRGGRRFLTAGVLLALLPCTARGESAAIFGEQEQLTYTVNWPSGLSLGEARLNARLSKEEAAGAGRWILEFEIEAALPGFQVADRARAAATAEFCSLELEKVYRHGKRQAREKTTFDQEARLATRRNLEGNASSRIPTRACARDALTFLYFLRLELSRGRIPPPQTVLFGSPYEVSLQYAGAGRAKVGGEAVESDRLMATVKGPASESTFLIEIAKDAARTPVRITVPFEQGSFTMELAQE